MAAAGRRAPLRGGCQRALPPVPRPGRTGRPVTGARQPGPEGQNYSLSVAHLVELSNGNKKVFDPLCKPIRPLTARSAARRTQAYDENPGSEAAGKTEAQAAGKPPDLKPKNNWERTLF